MPPVFGPLCAIKNALVVLRGRERQRRLAIAQREERGLLALHEFLDDDSTPDSPNPPPNIMSTAASASASDIATTTPLPAARPSALTTIGAPCLRI